MRTRITLTAATGFVARIIRAVTRSPVSHAALRLGPDLFLHADRGGVQLSTLGEFLGSDRHIYAEFEATPGIEILVAEDVAYAKTLIGKPYDYIGLVGYLVPMFSWRWFKRKVCNPFARPQHFVCSEFVCFALGHDKHIAEFKGLDPAVISPGRLLRRLEHVRARSFVKVKDGLS